MTCLFWKKEKIKIFERSIIVLTASFFISVWIVFYAFFLNCYDYQLLPALFIPAILYLFIWKCEWVISAKLFVPVHILTDIDKFFLMIDDGFILLTPPLKKVKQTDCQRDFGFNDTLRFLWMKILLKEIIMLNYFCNFFFDLEFSSHKFFQIDE